MAKLVISQFKTTQEATSFYLSAVDEEVESLRMAFITKGEGQAMTYEDKYQEALQGGGPILSAEAEALGLSLSEVVTSVLEARERWRRITEKTEPIRLKCKRKIRDATSTNEMVSLIIQLKEDLRLTLDQISK